MDVPASGNFPRPAPDPPNLNSLAGQFLTRLNLGGFVSGEWLIHRIGALDAVGSGTMTRTQQIIFIVLLIALAVAQYLLREGYFKGTEAQAPDLLQRVR